jgi:hypothetical protein
MIWGCISHYGVGTITTVNGTINRHKYIKILEDNLWPVIARHFHASTLCCNPIFSFSHTFSITFKSGDCAGHSRQFIWFSSL